MSEVKLKSNHDRLWKAFEESFGQRRWKSIRLSWRDFIQKPSDEVADVPEMTLSNFVGQGGVLTQIPPKGLLTETLHPRGEVPEIIFREAVQWMHKAIHVLGASETHADQGLPSWSLSSAYQSAYFAARSIMAFFGVSVTEYERNSVIVDICRDVQGMRPKKVEEIGAFKENIPFYSIGILFDHRQTWLLFQRILRTSTCDIWPDGWGSYFAQLSMADLTRQRHGLHYQLHYWPLNDLHDFVHSDEFNNVDPSGTGRELFDSEKTNYSLAIGCALTRMAVSLFNDLRPLTNRLDAEQKKLLTTFSFERHPLFFEAFSSQLKADAY